MNGTMAILGLALTLAAVACAGADAPAAPDEDAGLRAAG